MSLGAVTSIASSVGLSIPGVSFATPSEKRAAKVLPSVVQSALTGNLTAFKCLDERRTIGIAKERAVWVGGYNQVVTQRPDLIAIYNQHKDKIPALNHSSPEAAAQSALANPYAAPGTTQNTVSAPDKPALSAAFDSTVKAAGNLPLWVTLVIAGAAGWWFYKMVKKG